MPREFPTYLRVVAPGEKKSTPEATNTFKWDQEPRTLEDVLAVVTELHRQCEELDGKNVGDLNYALERIERSFHEDSIGLAIEENPIPRTALLLIRTFELLQKTQKTIDSIVFPELFNSIEHTAVTVMERVVELAAKGGTSEQSAPNPAFRFTLHAYAHEPTYRDLIEEQLPQPGRRTKLTANWQTRAQEQMAIEELGTSLLSGQYSARTTMDLLRYLPTAMANFTERLFLNPTIQTRKRLTINGLTSDILREIRSKGEDAMERFGVLRQNGYAPQDIATPTLPQLGDYNVLCTVLPEIQREKTRWSRLKAENDGKIKLEQCNSWFLLVWFVNEVFKRDEEFRFSIIDDDTGLEKIKLLTGAEVIECVEQAVTDQEYVYKLPSEHNVKKIRPQDILLVKIRTKLQEVLN